MTALRMSGSRLGYKIHFHEVEMPGKILKMTVLKYMLIPWIIQFFVWAIVVVEKERPGELDAAALKADGLPFGPLFGKIKSGETVEYEGKVFHPEDYIGADKLGKVLTILGDTRRTPSAVRLAVGADLLVHEATYEQKSQKMARRHGHSTSKQAADVAQEAGVKRLLLTHISCTICRPTRGSARTRSTSCPSNHNSKFWRKIFMKKKLSKKNK